MEYSRLIHDYLDGELDNVNQDVLFSELSHNQDLRIDFNRQVKLQIAAQNDLSALAPPAHTTNAIFASLGFSIPSQTFLQNMSKPAGAGIAATVAGTVMSFFARNIAVVSSIALTALITTSVIFVSQNYFTSNTKYAKNSNNSSVSERVLKGSTQIPITSSVETFADNGKLNTNSAQITENGNKNTSGNRNFTGNINNGNSGNSNRRSIANNTVRNSRQGPASSNAQNDLTLNSGEQNKNSQLQEGSLLLSPNDNFYQRVRLFTPTYGSHSGLVSNSNLPESIDFASYFSGASSDNTTWSVQGRQMNARSFKVYSGPSQQKKWNDDLSFTVLYKFDPYNNLGLEFGWENFSQVFTYMDAGRNNNWNQNPKLFWLGAAYRLNFLDYGIGDYIYPYLQFLVGGTGIGPLAKGQIGLQLRPINLINLSACLEGTGLGYKVSQTYYFTGKYGFSIGGGINF
ncbi:MAG: hypothetical protein ABSG15_09850 [FCB group bacterium]|jgi:hypothetical protein